jgi:hypothetical protein
LRSLQFSSPRIERKVYLGWKDSFTVVKTAQEMLRHITSQVSLPEGSIISLVEMVGETPNWEANFNAMGVHQARTLQTLLNNLSNSDPKIDWSNEKIRSGSERRTTHFRQRQSFQQKAG